MSGVAAATRPETTSVRRAWAALVIVGVAIVAYATLIHLPYYVNGLDQVPIEDVVGGAHDPKDLWPLTSPLGMPLRIAGTLSLLLAPFVAVSVLLWSLFELAFVRGRTSHERVVTTAAGVLALVFLAWHFSPLSIALGTWYMD